MNTYLYNHYKVWAETTRSGEHRDYAETMLQAVIDGNHKEVWKRISNAKALYHPDTKQYYHSIEEAALDYNITSKSMQKNYYKFGLKRAI